MSIAHDGAAQPTGTTQGGQAPLGGHTPEVADAINRSLRYAMYAVFEATSPLPADADERARMVADLLADLTGDDGPDGLVVRGWYDVAGLRADADLMVWWHGPTIESVQDAFHRLRASDIGAHLLPVWSVAAMHRPAEFNRGHVPAFLAGEDPGAYICVYPFVRSYEWYVLPDDERREMLREHGHAARDYADVRASTLSSFALGDYEWVLAFEADELHRIVDLMRDLRATRARLHVREEVPFYTGPRVELAQWADRQPRHA